MPGGRFGNYELLAEIGQGGTAVIWRARQSSVNRIVALKLLRSAELASQEARERFRMEAAAVASLRHPHIVALHEFGVHEGQPWISMELVEGATLAALVRKQPWDSHRAAAMLKTIAEGIAYAHSRGILHRDLKPSNILVDQFGQPRISDFGLAKPFRITASDIGTAADLDGLVPEGPARADLTLTGQLLGTPNYMPPEQLMVRSGAIGPHSDVYSLGAVLYEMLTGFPPFLGASVEATLLHVINTDSPSTRLLNPGVPLDLDTICLKCLEKEGARRYPTAQALADELARFLRGEPIQARPIGTAGQLWRWSRRKPALAASLLGLFAALTLGAGLTSWQWRRAEARAADLGAALLEMRLQRVGALFDKSDSATAVALLARMLREEPGNEVVRLRLSAALAQRQFNRSVVPPMRHDSIRIGLFSPDGRHLITTSEKNIRLWDARSGLFLTEIPHPAPIRPRFSPDGKLLATLSAPSSIQVWDVAARDKLGPPLLHDQTLYAAQLGANGRPPTSAPPWEYSRQLWIACFIDNSRLAVQTSDGMLHLWDVRRGELLRSALKPNADFSLDGQVFLTPHGNVIPCWDAQSWELIHSFEHESPVQWARLSPQGDRLATVLSDRKLRIWDVRGGRLISDAITLEGDLWAIVFAPDGERIAAQLRINQIHLFDVASARRLAVFPSQSRPIEERSFAPDGVWLAVTQRDAIDLWNTKTGKRAAEPILHEGRIALALFGAKSAQLLATAVHGGAHIWNFRPDPSRLGSLAHQDIVTSIEFRADGAAVLTASKDATARVWDARNGTPITPPMHHQGRIEMARFSPDGSKVATGSTDGSARIWDSRTGAPLTPPLHHDGPIRSVAFDSQGERVLTASAIGTARIWSGRTGELFTTIVHSNVVTMAAFDREAHRVVTTCHDGLARIWQLRGTKAVLVTSVRHNVGVQAAVFSPDGRQFATGGLDRTARVWDPTTGQPISPPLRHSFDVARLRFSQNGQYLLTACEDGAARIWDIQSGTLRAKPMRHTDKVYDAVFSPDERFVLTTSEDDTVRVWDAATGYEIAEPLEQGPTMASAQFSPDGRTIAVAAPRNTAQLWNVSFLFDRIPSPWLADFAEWVVGRRLLPDDSLEPVLWERLPELKRQFQQQYPGLDLPNWITKYTDTQAAKDPP